MAIVGCRPCPLCGNYISLHRRAADAPVFADHGHTKVRCWASGKTPEEAERLAEVA